MCEKSKKSLFGGSSNLCKDFITFDSYVFVLNDILNISLFKVGLSYKSVDLLRVSFLKSDGPRQSRLIRDGWI